MADVAGRVLPERDHALRGVLDGAVEDLAPRHVRTERVDLPLPAGEAEGEVGFRPDDPDDLGRVELLRDSLHLLAQRVPVDEHGAVEELLELRQGQPRVLRRRLGREVAADPGLLVAQVGLVRRAHRLLPEAGAFGRHVGALARILGRDQRHVRIGRLDLLQLDLAQGAEDLERRLPDENPADGVEAEADERTHASPAELPADLVDERAPERLRADEHLPARLRVDAVDQQARVGRNPRVPHPAIIPRGRHPAARPPPRRPPGRSADGPRRRPRTRAARAPGGGRPRPPSRSPSAARCEGARSPRSSRRARARRSGRRRP